MDDVIIRPATDPDLDALVELATAFRDHLRQSTPTPQQFHDRFARLLGDPATEFLLACRPRGQALGYVQSRYRISAWVNWFAELEDVFVLPAARRHGVGERLVEHALQRALERGCRAVGVSTNERNAPALALYAGAGFRAKRAYWDGGRQLWLERDLDEQ